MFPSHVQNLPELCGAEVQNQWDAVARLGWKGKRVWRALAPDSTLATVLELPGVRGDDQYALFSWSAMAHVRDTDPQGTKYIARPKLVKLARHVAKGMVCELQNKPWVLPVVHREVGDISPYRQHPRSQVALSYDIQYVVAWLFRWDPYRSKLRKRQVLARPWHMA